MQGVRDAFIDGMMRVAESSVGAHRGRISEDVAVESASTARRLHRWQIDRAFRELVRFVIGESHSP